MLYMAHLTDTHMVATVTAQLEDGLKRIDHSYLSEKFKIWCYHHTLYQRIMWPLKICDITASAAIRMDTKPNNFICKWLGLPRCLSNLALFDKNTLVLPLKSISLGYKQEKVRLVFQLRDSPDPTIKNARVEVRTERKWNAAQMVHQAISQLKHQ